MYTDQNSFSSDQNSAQQKIYCCFCQKLFATYPGIYQHLKSKHANLFPTYKKRKIKKMLRKSRDSRGIYTYRLVKLPEALINSLSGNCQQKKVSENNQSKIRKSHIVQPPNKISENQNVPLGANSKQNQQKKVEQQIPVQQKNSKNPEVAPPNERDSSEPIMSYPTEMPIYPPPFPHYPPYMFPHYLPPLNPQYWLTVKALLVRFLYEVPDLDKELTQAYLYELMIFIDKNYRQTKDPRIEDRLFLSYCDQFDPHYLGPLVSRHIQRLESRLKEEKLSLSEKETKEKTLQIDCVRTFGLWLDEAGLLKLQIKKQSAETPHQSPDAQSKEKVLTK